jgi:hypothetical protein
MASVETVRGPVELDSLGQTLMHEHVFVLSTEHVQNYGSDWWDEEARVADAIAKLNSLYAKGIHTIVDPTLGYWPVHPAYPADRRADAGQHHRGRRLVRLRGAAAAVRLPRARAAA